MEDQGPETIFSTSPRRTKYVVSLAVYYCNFILGICVTFLSPLVLDFSYKFNATVDQVSKVFTIILMCYLTSALVSTLLFRCISRQLVVIFLLTLASTSFFLIPNATNLTEFFLASSLIGLGGGGYDTAQVAWIIDLWRHESPPWILGQHFSYSLGTLAPPLLLAYFLPNAANGTHGGNNDTTTTAPVPPQTESDVHVPFFVAGAFAIIAIIINVALYFYFRNSQASFSIIDNDVEAEAEEPIPGTSHAVTDISIPQESLNRKACLVGLACCVIGFYSALELCTQQFLPTFTHFSPLHLTPIEGAKVLFALQLGFAIGRFFGIILVLKIAAQFIFLGNLILLLTSNSILFFLAGNSIEWLWVGSIMIGFGMSTVYPSLYAFIEKYLFVTEGIAGIITISGSLVSSTYPVIVGNSVEKNPQILMYVNYVSICVCSVAFSVLFWVTHCKSSQRYKKLT